jgi:hypothetical protein
VNWLSKDTQHEINEKIESFFRKGVRQNEVNFDLYDRFYECDHDEIMEEDFDDYVQFNVDKK